LTFIVSLVLLCLSVQGGDGLLRVLVMLSRYICFISCMVFFLLCWVIMIDMYLHVQLCRINS